MIIIIFDTEIIFLMFELKKFKNFQLKNVKILVIHLVYYFYYNQLFFFFFQNNFSMFFYFFLLRVFFFVNFLFTNLFVNTGKLLFFTGKENQILLGKILFSK